jgi:hypothetical protein
MLQNIEHLYGRKLRAVDGDIGCVKDFYFDDQSWAVRYLVADTGSWLPGRQVLLPPRAFMPQAFGKADAALNILRVDLTRKQIENSPSIDSHLPVSRQYEEEYHRYYGWPSYWQNDGVGGAAGLPPVAPPPDTPPHHGHNQRDDVHLHSTTSVTGYQIQTTDGPIGTVSTFMIDGLSWAIREIAIEAGHWYAGKKVFLLPENIERVSYEGSAVFVNLSREDIRQTTRNDIVQVETSYR